MGAPLGTIIYASVKPIFKIYFIIALGFYLARRNILSVTTCRDISDAIVTAIMPCLIFDNVVTNLKSSDIKNIGVIFFEGTILFSIGALLSLATFYICKSPKTWFGGLISVGLFPNISDLPIAYLQTLSKTGSLFSKEEGDKGVAYVCIFLASQVFYQYSLGLFRLVRYDFRDELDGRQDQEQEIDGGPLHSVSSSPQVTKEAHSGSVASDEESYTADSPTRPPTAREPSEFRQHDDFLMQRNSHELDSIASSVRQRRGTNTSGATNYYSLHQTHSRSADLRRAKSQDVEDVIQEYSEFDRLKSNEARSMHSGTSDVGISVAPLERNEKVQEEKEETESRRRRCWKGFLNTVVNFKTPNSVSLIVSLIIAMSPPLKALFVETSFSMPNAPDEMPPLSFLMDLTSYVGAASVPLGLLLLGATIARLKVNQIIPGFWKTALMVTASRLIIMPIFGVGFTTGLYKAGWFGEDKLVRFVSVLEFGLPNATALVYFTAFYTDPNSPDHVQMDCLAICLMAQYAILFITLPFLVTFTMKESLNF
ncbi:hypothetical protein FT663_00729 [Candidozyma haemuli var. vulneris]|uniref:Protein ECM3 n=1 Tax=Candidozyma haemuli TaxID=45357 RepID=A0A2V1APN7_9ASCO|nr:hypothetical protein CXQ85_003676 [[Candida] haemuloni]KAF3992449.1 hypothetical protein FT662_01158 [[Candida] haemuloni var. vulneris]KAF3995186.1 hypothetical protein FT663_00729 [[Candida] haemuloni var. vulneris]PVH19818.1 hypothetical protein CXQ85_003676 [[Candida] haemuloni]